mmetsp:Transcript_96074/g.293901  ORF Transcript_96074/g.293901 Transcript_96074/m.293901 type:complete len:243 (-) Transcript_96074:146-874(-)
MGSLRTLSIAMSGVRKEWPFARLGITSPCAPTPRGRCGSVSSRIQARRPPTPSGRRSRAPTAPSPPTSIGASARPTPAPRVASLPLSRSASICRRCTSPEGQGPLIIRRRKFPPPRWIATSTASRSRRTLSKIAARSAREAAYVSTDTASTTTAAKEMVPAISTPSCGSQTHREITPITRAVTAKSVAACLGRPRVLPRRHCRRVVISHCATATHWPKQVPTVTSQARTASLREVIGGAAAK